MAPSPRPGRPRGRGHFSLSLAPTQLRAHTGAERALGSPGGSRADSHRLVLRPVLLSSLFRHCFSFMVPAGLEERVRNKTQSLDSPEPTIFKEKCYDKLLFKVESVARTEVNADRCLIPAPEGHGPTFGCWLYCPLTVWEDQS